MSRPIHSFKTSSVQDSRSHSKTPLQRVLRRVRKAGELIAHAGRTVFVAAMVFAPWAYGCTRQAQMQQLDWILFISGAFLAVGLVLGAKVRLAWIPVVFTIVLLAYGWASFAIPKYYADLVLWEQPWLEDWLDPLAVYATANNPLALRTMINLSAILVGFLVAIDVWSHPEWRLRCARIVAISAVVFAVYGILQRSTGFLQLMSENGRVPLSFAMYRYWGNAGAFLNLVWPLTGAWAIRSFRRHGANSFVFLGWLLATFTIYGACFINISKAGNMLALGGLLLMLPVVGVFLFRVRKGKREGRRISWKPTLIAGALLLLVAGSLATMLPWQRWEVLAKQLEGNGEPRAIAYQQWWKAVEDGGLLGFGPGSFDSVNRRYVEDIPAIKNIPWWVAHQDYLQTLVEWGVAGGSIWFALIGLSFFILLVRLVVDWFRAAGSDPDPAAIPRATWIGAALLAISLILLHASVDFPLQIASTQLYFAWWGALAWARLV